MRCWPKPGAFAVCLTEIRRTTANNLDGSSESRELKIGQFY